MAKAISTTTVDTNTLTETDRADLSNEAIGLGNLLRWVAEAQMALSQLRSAVHDEPEWQERLSRMGIAFNSPEIYCNSVDHGLYFVHARQLEIINQLGGGAA